MSKQYPAQNHDEWLALQKIFKVKRKSDNPYVALHFKGRKQGIWVHGDVWAELCDQVIDLVATDRNAKTDTANPPKPTPEKLREKPMDENNHPGTYIQAGS